MSTSYDVTTFAGVQVDANWMWERTVRTACQCGHRIGKGSRYCPSCGREVGGVEHVLTVREHVWKDHGYDELEDFEYALRDGAPVRKVNDKVSIFMADPYGENNRVLVAGVKVGRVDDLTRRSGVARLPMPDLSQADVEDALREAGIPFIEGTWGLHVLASVY